MALEVVGVVLPKPLLSGGDSVTAFTVEYQLDPSSQSGASVVDGGATFAGPSPSSPPDHMSLAFFRENVFARVITIRPTAWTGASIVLRAGVLSKRKVGFPDYPGLNSAKCHSMLHDPTHLFRRMWAAEVRAQTLS